MCSIRLCLHTASNKECIYRLLHFTVELALLFIIIYTFYDGKHRLKSAVRKCVKKGRVCGLA